MEEFQYFSQTIALDAEETAKLRALTVPYVDQDVSKMSPADIIYNMQMLQKLSSEAAQVADSRDVIATLQQKVKDLELELSNLQKLYYAITRPTV